MEEPSRTCPAGGTILIGVSSPADPVDGSLYLDVTCTTCGHVGTDNVRARVDGFADWHLTDGWRNPGADPEPSTLTPEELAAAASEVTRQHQPGGAYGTLTPGEKDTARRALARISWHRQFTNLLGEALQCVWDDHVGDTRTVPGFLDLAIEDGQVAATANFRHGDYVWKVAEHVLDRDDTSGALVETRALAFMLYRTLADRPVDDLAWLTPEAKALLREIVHDLNPSVDPDTDRADDPSTADTSASERADHV